MAIKKDTLDQLLSGRYPKEVFSKAPSRGPVSSCKASGS
jgi:hypothetical protein